MSCAQNQGPGQITDCQDPVRSFCDDSGQYGLARTCIADPMTSACTGPSDCTRRERPLCVDRTCVECEDARDCGEAAPVCNPVTHLCNACTDELDCSGRGYCLAATGACVGCRDQGDCGVAAPICDVGAHACRGCQRDSECDSEVCDEDTGACVPEDQIVYVEAGQAGPCTRAAPCGSLALGLAAVTPSQSVLKVRRGNYVGPIAVSGRTVRIVGADATVRPAASGDGVVAVTAGADVTIEGLTVTGAEVDTPAVLCAPEGGLKTTLRLHGARVHGNRGGAVVLDGCEFSLINNVIHDNGTAGQALAAIEIRRVSAAAELHRLEFNTIVDNRLVDGPVVACSLITQTMTFSNNIVYDNGDATVRPVSTNARCQWAYSIIGPQAAVQAGTGNRTDAPQLDADLHLQPGSPATAAADPTATVSRDIDGDPRPVGTGRADIGADEIVE